MATWSDACSTRDGTRVDERDVMFARAARRPGTPAYEDYYRRHPERQAVDDRLRALPELLLPGGRHYDERTCRDAMHYFHAIGDIAVDAKDVERWASEVRELGRHNILVAGRAGTRVRIGAVTTDAPVTFGRPVSLGVEQFCRLCKKCAANCPSHALSEGERVEVRGVMKWPTHVERCYGYWRSLGTDCGICMSVCPFSHPDTPLHRFVRATLRRAPALARLALWFDDRIYGRTWEERRREACAIRR